LITPDICDVFCKHNVLVGISLDGGAEANSQRVTLKGEPTLTTVTEKINLLKAYAGHLFGGILCVVNLDADPIEILGSLCAYDPPEIDLLYPLVTHDHPDLDRRAMAMKFGSWMVTAMNYWIEHPKFSTIKVRIFEDALQSTISRRPKTGWFGLRNVNYLVVETAGGYDLLDQLKVIGTKSSYYRNVGRNVYNSSIKDAVVLASELLKKSGGVELPTDCIGCKWSDVCGGSNLPARHSLDRGFNNRSVYCDGIQDLLNAVHDAMVKYKERRAN
jgi:uncharacterized protein